MEDGDSYGFACDPCGGVDVNEVNPLSGAGVLHVAAQAGDVHFARWALAQRDIDPAAADFYGVQPLHKAVAFGHVPVVQALLAHPRVSVDAVVGEPSVPSEYAAVSGSETPLQLAAGHRSESHARHTQIATLLLEAGADPNARCGWRGRGRTAAHRAAHAGNVGVVEALLACRRTRWDLSDLDGRSPRQLAVERGHHHIVALLDRHGRRRAAEA